jgi:DNA processing protein
MPKSDTKLLAVVGSRQYSDYGKMVCETLIEELAPYNISIVSGLALGIDSIAHRKAMEVGLHTIAIPGSGLDDSVIYPKSHLNLAKDIEKNGALLSEFEPTTSAATYTFPKRNRIIAGISHATLVIEAAPRSGTLITARLAMEYNRDVLTVPGSIYSRKSFGPHSLIKNGAALIQSGADIVEILGLEIAPTKKKIPLTAMENILYIELSTSISKDELIEKSKLSIEEIDLLLSTLELKGAIETKLGKIRHKK